MLGTGPVQVGQRNGELGGVEDASRPSEIFRSNIFGCFIYDDAGLANIDLIGEDNIMFEIDYPHSDSNWPHAREMLAKSLANVPDDLTEDR